MLKKLIFASILVLAQFPSATGRATVSEAISWHKNYDLALKLAKQTGKPILLDFWADWCPPCKTMDQEVWPHRKVVALAEKFVCVSVDVDRDAATARRYHINPIPTVVFADPWGNPLTRHEGYIPALALARLMEIIPKDYSEAKDSFATLEENGKDGQALFQIGEFYRKHNIGDLSNHYYKRALKSKDVEVDKGLKETILLVLGLNYLKMKKYDDARKSFEQCLKEAPNGKECDKAMLGIVTAHINKRKLAEAEKVFHELRAKYPESAATQQAAKNLELARSQQK